MLSFTKLYGFLEQKAKIGAKQIQPVCTIIYHCRLKKQVSDLRNVVKKHVFYDLGFLCAQKEFEAIFFYDVGKIVLFRFPGTFGLL